MFGHGGKSLSGIGREHSSRVKNFKFGFYPQVTMLKTKVKYVIQENQRNKWVFLKRLKTTLSSKGKNGTQLMASLSTLRNQGWQQDKIKALWKFKNYLENSKIPPKPISSSLETLLSL